MSDLQAELGKRRDRIDEIDAELLRLVNERATLAMEIGRLKRDANRLTYTPAREREVFDKVTAANPGPLSDRTIRAIFRELMSGSFPLVRPPRVAYLGPPGSFSHLAATRKFGESVEYTPLKQIDAVFDGIVREHVDLGLVPVENSLGGGVVDTLVAFTRHEVHVCGEINLAIRHHLLANCPLEDVQKVYSKPEAFPQCQQWLTENGLIANTIAVASTSKAAELAAAEPGAAAVGSELAADLYDLRVVCDRIEDDPGNVTRFLLLGREPAQPTGNDKTALFFVAADQPGALVDVLDKFRQADINMTFVESHPSRARTGEYCFFLDIEGHVEESAVQAAIDAARVHCLKLRVLGSFPRANEVH
jgi:chorismate mutase/prephenate dehydratase